MVALKENTEKLVLGTNEKRSQSWKPGARVLGIAESFSKDDRKSTVTGVIMRGDLRIDGFGLCQPTVGGLDSTEEIISMYERLNRPDIRALLLSGTIISWFNIVDLEALFEAVGIPIVSVTYEETEGIKKYIREYFPEDYERRIELAMKCGERERIILKTEHNIFVNVVGMSMKRCRNILNLFTLEGKIPEPIRVAKLIAGAIRNHFAQS